MVVNDVKTTKMFVCCCLFSQGISLFIFHAEIIVNWISPTWNCPNIFRGKNIPKCRFVFAVCYLEQRQVIEEVQRVPLSLRVFSLCVVLTHMKIIKTEFSSSSFQTINFLPFIWKPMQKNETISRNNHFSFLLFFFFPFVHHWVKHKFLSYNLYVAISLPLLSFFLSVYHKTVFI